MLNIELPFPPSVNHYYRRVGPRTLISREGRAYREKVCSVLRGLGITELPGRLAMVIDAFPPDRRRRDLDNMQKSLLDSLEKGGAYKDDSQIDLLAIRRKTPVPDGGVIVALQEFPLGRCPLCGGCLPLAVSRG